MSPCRDEGVRSRVDGEGPHAAVRLLEGARWDRGVAAFDADAGGPEPAPCLVAAGRPETVRETVLRYGREDAAPGRRPAPWMRSRGPR